MKNIEALRRRVEMGETFEYVLFWGHTPRGDGTLGKECFSQWYWAEFTLDGVTYYTAEHYMMAGKARVFGDDDMFAQILAAATPAEANVAAKDPSAKDPRAWRGSNLLGFALMEVRSQLAQ